MDVIGGIAAFFNINRTKARIDNNVCRLHYRVSFIILVIFSLIIMAGQYIGDPIDCITRDDIPDKLIDRFCWIHTTFSMDGAWDKKVGEEVPYPGIASSKNNGNRVYHAYYQWVCWVLAIQACLFYVPHFFWKAVEDGRLSGLMLRLKCQVLKKEEKKQDIDSLVEYFRINMRQSHGVYFYVLVAAEFLNFVNVVGQIFLMDKFLGGAFSTYGSKVVSFTQYDWRVRDDPMIRVFPRLTKCIFHRFGPSGDVTTHDVMCMMPINILNEKLYIFLWFWFVLLAIVTGLTLVYRAVLIVSPKLRKVVLKSDCKSVDPSNLSEVMHYCNFGDYMLVSLLGSNLNAMNFSDLVRELAKVLREKGLVQRGSLETPTLLKTKLI